MFSSPSSFLHHFFFFSSLFSTLCMSSSIVEDSILTELHHHHNPQNGQTSGNNYNSIETSCTSWRVAAEANNLAPWTTIPEECNVYIKDYMTSNNYRSDLEMVAVQAAQFARSVHPGDDGLDAWVFDIDDTLLSNLPYYATHGFGIEIFDPYEFDKWVEKGAAPAVPSSVKLYEEVLHLGFKIILLTGRSEKHHLVTVENLKRAGFRDWEKLIVRGARDHGKSARQFKSEKRSELVAAGLRILGNSGDQWSDLLGSFASNRSFKLPNPMYYIP